MFTQPCLISNNTKELRDKLQELGYKMASKTYLDERPRGILCRPNLAIGVPEDCCEFNIDEYLKDNPNIIDCGTNEDLFLALAALRDDNDYMQWFKVVSAECIKWVKSAETEFCYDAAHNVWHKATPKELIEHFKEE